MWPTERPKPRLFLVRRCLFFLIIIILFTFIYPQSSAESLKTICRSKEDSNIPIVIFPLWPHKAPIHTLIQPSSWRPVTSIFATVRDSFLAHWYFPIKKQGVRVGIGKGRNEKYQGKSIPGSKKKSNLRAKKITILLVISSAHSHGQPSSFKLQVPY